MSELGELLELLHGAGGRWETVRLTVRQWQDSAQAGEAMRRHADRRRSHGTMVAFASRGDSSHGDGPSEWESVTRAWIDRPGERSRLDADGPHGERLSVTIGNVWWSYTPMTGAISNQRDPEVGGGGSGELDHLLEPSSLIAAFDFTVTGTAQVAGRSAVTAVATPRSEDLRRGFGGHIALGADEVTLAVDRERGVLLRTEARLDGRPFSVHEVIDIAFDEALDDAFFEFTPPDGSPIRSPRETFGRPEQVPVEEAARRASFTVVAPTRLPEGWWVEASYVPPSVRPTRPDSVNIEVWAGDGGRRQVRLHIRQGGEPIHDQLDWEAVERDGRQILVFRNDAKVDVDGTHVRLSGHIDRDTLVDIAASLRPAPGELPPLREC